MEIQLMVLKLISTDMGKDYGSSAYTYGYWHHKSEIHHCRKTEEIGIICNIAKTIITFVSVRTNY